MFTYYLLFYLSSQENMSSTMEEVFVYYYFPDTYNSAWHMLTTLMNELYGLVTL